MSDTTLVPTIRQDMINAYDEYTHLTLDRRGFMERLAKLAGSGAAAAAIAPLLAANSAQAAMVEEADARLEISEVTYPGQGGDVKGYLALPKERAGKLPGVIVIHENRGLNAHIKDVARRVALEGFVALAPDYLSDLGGTPANEDDARGLFQQLNAGDVTANGVATIAYLKTVPKSTGKVGAIGFCWGGATVNNLAVASPELLAAVPYYGSQPSAEDVAKIQGRVMAHYGGLDERINAGIKDYEAALKANGKAYELFVYDGVNHAFNNDTNAARYDKTAADLAWGRTVGFLKKNLA